MPVSYLMDAGQILVDGDGEALVEQLPVGSAPGRITTSESEAKPAIVDALTDRPIPEGH